MDLSHIYLAVSYFSITLTNLYIQNNAPTVFFSESGASYSSRMMIRRYQNRLGLWYGTGGAEEALAIQQDGDVEIVALGTGTLYTNNGVLTNSSPSDSRLKSNIEDINYGLAEILQLRSVKFNWLEENKNQNKQFGFIAQEVKEIIPESVTEFDHEDDTRLALEKDAIYVGLVKAVQEQQAQIEELRSEIQLLKNS